jgi:hypothetical protein
MENKEQYGIVRSVNSLLFKPFFSVKFYNAEKKFGFTECGTHFSSSINFQKGDKFHGDIVDEKKGKTIKYIERPFDVKVVGDALMAHVENDGHFGEELNKVCPYLYLGTDFGFTDEQRGHSLSDDKKRVFYQVKKVEASYWYATKNRLQNPRIKVETGMFEWVDWSDSVKSIVVVTPLCGKITKEHFYIKNGERDIVSIEVLAEIEGFLVKERRTYNGFYEDNGNLIFGTQYGCVTYSKTGEILGEEVAEWKGGWKKSQDRN